MRTAEAYRAMVEAALPLQLAKLGDIPEPLYSAMRYSLLAGGKRLRPVLLLAAAEAMGVAAEEAMPYACALEMIHTYSLIHDDLPAMDNDTLRRGMPTNHVVYGEAVAILAGDGLLNAAMELMLQTACTAGSLRGMQAAEAIIRRAGVTGMIAGQNNDVTLEGTTPTVEKVAYIHMHKTADLLTAPFEAAMRLAGADATQLEQAVAFGQHLGMAFQMVDDLLDIEGDAALLGKTLGKDAAEGKLTAPAVLGIEATRAAAKEHISAAVACAECFGTEKAWFTTLAEETLHRVS